jgi:hypothetical protein
MCVGIHELEQRGRVDQIPVLHSAQSRDISNVEERTDMGKHDPVGRVHIERLCLSVVRATSGRVTNYEIG